MRVGELIVTVVGQRQIARAAIVEFFDAGDVLTERIAVLDAHEGDFFTLRVDSANVGGGERELDLARRDLAGKALDGVEFLNRELVGALVTGSGERIRILRLPCLADVDAEEQRVEAAVDHIRQIELGFETLRVIALAGQIGRSEINVSVEIDHLLVNSAGFFDQCVLGGRSLREWT